MEMATTTQKHQGSSTGSLMGHATPALTRCKRDGNVLVAATTKCAGTLPNNVGGDAIVCSHGNSNHERTAEMPVLNQSLVNFSRLSERDQSRFETSFVGGRKNSWHSFPQLNKVQNLFNVTDFLGGQASGRAKQQSAKLLDLIAVSDFPTNHTISTFRSGAPCKCAAEFALNVLHDRQIVNTQIHGNDTGVRFIVPDNHCAPFSPEHAFEFAKPFGSDEIALDSSVGFLNRFITEAKSAFLAGCSGISFWMSAGGTSIVSVRLSWFLVHDVPFLYVLSSTYRLYKIDSTTTRDYVSYWVKSGQSRAGLRPLIQDRVGHQMVETFNKLIRNAFLATSYVNLVNSSATGADQLVSTDKFDLGIIDQSVLRAMTQNVWTSPIPGLPQGSLLCVGTPGQHYDIVTAPTGTSNKWIELQKYASLKPFNDFEVGSYHNSRHLITNDNVLWNCGKVTTQTTITAPASGLDGAPDPAITKVDGTYKVGQAGTLATHSITVASSAGFAVGQRVTIHKTRVQAAAAAANPKLRVLNSPNYDEGTFLSRRIVNIPDPTHLVFERPLLTNFLLEVNSAGTGALTPSSGVYGWVTQGISLHVNIMIADPSGVVCGMCVPPRMYNPAPIDTFASVYRVGQLTGPSDEQLSDENCENCWDTPKPESYSVVCEDERESMKMFWMFSYN